MSSPGEGIEIKSSGQSWFKKNQTMVLAVLAVLILLAIGYYVMYHTNLLSDEESSAEGLGRGVKITSA